MNPNNNLLSLGKMLLPALCDKMFKKSSTAPQ